jgi:hypothetical protein
MGTIEGSRDDGRESLAVKPASSAMMQTQRRMGGVYGQPRAMPRDRSAGMK